MAKRKIKSEVKAVPLPEPAEVVVEETGTDGWPEHISRFTDFDIHLFRE